MALDLRTASIPINVMLTHLSGIHRERQYRTKLQKWALEASNTTTEKRVECADQIREHQAFVQRGQSLGSIQKDTTVMSLLDMMSQLYLMSVRLYKQDLIYQNEDNGIITRGILPGDLHLQLQTCSTLPFGSKIGE